MHFTGGPLDGIRLRVTPRESIWWRLGFCTLPDTAPVQALYSDGGDGRRVIEGVARVG